MLRLMIHNEHPVLFYRSDYATKRDEIYAVIAKSNARFVT